MIPRPGVDCEHIAPQTGSIAFPLVSGLLLHEVSDRNLLGRFDAHLAVQQTFVRFFDGDCHLILLALFVQELCQTLFHRPKVFLVMRTLDLGTRGHLMSDEPAIVGGVNVEMVAARLFAHRGQMRADRVNFGWFFHNHDIRSYPNGAYCE
jgi:hypothetical protein